MKLTPILLLTCGMLLALPSCSFSYGELPLASSRKLDFSQPGKYHVDTSKTVIGRGQDPQAALDSLMRKAGPNCVAVQNAEFGSRIFLWFWFEGHPVYKH